MAFSSYVPLNFQKKINSCLKHPEDSQLLLFINLTFLTESLESCVIDAQIKIMTVCEAIANKEKHLSESQSEARSFCQSLIK